MAATPAAVERESDLLYFNVGGKKFTTTRGTVFSRGRENFLAALVSNDEGGLMPCPRDNKGRLFVDRSPRGFEMILDFLRSGVLHRPGSWTDDQVLAELDFYQIKSTTSSSRSSCRLEAGQAAQDWWLVEEHREAIEEQARTWVEGNHGALVGALLEEMRRGQYKSDITSVCPSLELTFNYETGTRTGPPQLRLQGGASSACVLEDSCARNPLWLHYVARELRRESRAAGVTVDKAGTSLRIRFQLERGSPGASATDLYELLDSCRASRDDTRRYTWEVHDLK